jgi:hypothetical protein
MVYWDYTELGKCGVLPELSMHSHVTAFAALAKLPLNPPPSTVVSNEQPVPVKPMQQAFCLESLEHTMPCRNGGISPSLPPLIVRAGGAQEKRRSKANSISLHRKRKPSKGFDWSSDDRSSNGSDSQPALTCCSGWPRLAELARSRRWCATTTCREAVVQLDALPSIQRPLPIFTLLHVCANSTTQ